jgi:hypothetical protein
MRALVANIVFSTWRNLCQAQPNLSKCVPQETAEGSSYAYSHVPTLTSVAHQRIRLSSPSSITYFMDDVGSEDKGVCFLRLSWMLTSDCQMACGKPQVLEMGSRTNQPSHRGPGVIISPMEFLHSHYERQQKGK